MPQHTCQNPSCQQGNLQIMHRRPPVRKTSGGSLRMRQHDRPSSAGEADSSAFSRASTDGADSQASSAADIGPTEHFDSAPHSFPSQQQPQSPHFPSSSWNFSEAQSQDSWAQRAGRDSLWGPEQAPSVGGRRLRRQLTGPKPRMDTSHQPGIPQLHTSQPQIPGLQPQSQTQPFGSQTQSSSSQPQNFGAFAPMQNAPRMESIPESPRQSLPSAEVRRWSAAPVGPPDPLARPSVGLPQPTGPGRGVRPGGLASDPVGLARASVPAQGRCAGATPADSWAAPPPVGSLREHYGAAQYGTQQEGSYPVPPPIRTHGTPAGFRNDPPTATISVVAGSGSSAIRAGPIGGPPPSVAFQTLPAQGSQPGHASQGRYQSPGQHQYQPTAGPSSMAHVGQVPYAAPAAEPEKGAKGKGVAAAASSSGGSCSEHLRAIGLLCQASAISGPNSALSNQHLRSMRMLCQACLSGGLLPSASCATQVYHVGGKRGRGGGGQCSTTVRAWSLAVPFDNRDCTCRLSILLAFLRATLGVKKDFQSCFCVVGSRRDCLSCLTCISQCAAAEALHWPRSNALLMPAGTPMEIGMLGCGDGGGQEILDKDA